MDNQKAIEILNLYEYSTKLELSEGYRNNVTDKISVEDFMQMKGLATKALEKQAFFENEVDEIHSWFVDNKESLLDAAMNVAHKKFKEISIENNGNEFTNIDLDFIVEDIVDKLQEGILNVLSTFMGKYKEN